MATGNSIIPLLPHVLEENFFLLYFFLPWLFSRPLHLLPWFSALILSKPLTQPYGLYPLYFPHPFTPTIPWSSSGWHHCFSSCMSLTALCFPAPSPRFLQPLQLLFFIFHVGVHLHVFPTPVSQVDTWLCIPFTPGSLQTLLEGLLTSWCSR